MSQWYILKMLILLGTLAFWEIYLCNNILRPDTLQSHLDSIVIESQQ